MKLQICLVCAEVIVRFSTPGPGSWAVIETVPGSFVCRVQQSGYARGPEHVTVKLPKQERCIVFVKWEAE